VLAVAPFASNIQSCVSPVLAGQMPKLAIFLDVDGLLSEARISEFAQRCVSLTVVRLIAMFDIVRPGVTDAT
jgi:hypothetical protein